MPISVTCPACSAGYRVPDSASGKALKCKKCGDTMSIPASKNGTAKSKAAATAKKGGAGKILAIVGGLVAVSCLLCIGVGGFSSWWFFGRTRAPVVVVNEAPKDAFKDMSKDLAKEMEKAFKDMSKGFK